MDKYVEIVENETGEVVRRLGPMSEREAAKTEGGVSINLNWDKFHIRIVDAEEEIGDE